VSDERAPDDPSELEQITGVDIRAVVVSWAEDDDWPVVDWSGVSSTFEAEALLLYACRYLEQINAPYVPDVDNEDDCA
jgi:hypothetical protein